MAHSGLVAKTVHVTGKNGKTYTRTYWVKASQATHQGAAPPASTGPLLHPEGQAALHAFLQERTAREAPRAAPPASSATPASAHPPGSEEHLHEAVRSAGGSHALASAMTENWIHSPHSAEALAMSYAAARAYGLDMAGTEARVRERFPSYVAGGPEPRLAEARRLAAGKRAEATVRAVARVSQAMHPPDADGLVTLYRGVGNARDNGDGTHTFATDALTSFTTDPEVAQRFARSYGGHVVAVRVPHRAIVASHRAVPSLRGEQADNEQEVIVASRGSFTGHAVSSHHGTHHHAS